MKWLIAVLTVLLMSSTASAVDIAPDVMVRNVSNEVLDVVRKDKGIQSGNTSKAIELVEAKVLPHFNFARMTSLAVGKDWRRANPVQQQSLTEEFRLLLVRTYSKALTEYRDQAMTIKLLRMQPDGSDATVRAKVNQAGGKAVDIDYSLEKSGQDWKVYDISVGGISLVTNYRGSFGEEISANGIDGLIKSLRNKNQNDTTSVSQKQ